MINHYLLFDNNVQWFAAVAALRIPPATHDHGDHQRVCYDDESFHDIPPSLWNTPFVSNLTAREPSFTNAYVRDNTWTGWSISEAEANQLIKLIVLRNSVDEYNRLVAYP